MISMIAATSKNGVIGKNNALPWNSIPEDFAWFKEQTMGKPIVMGSKTHLSIGRVLKGRDNIVLSQNNKFVPINSSVRVYNNIEGVLADYDNYNEIMVIGGEQIYRQFLPYAKRIYLTKLEAHFDGDAFFPELNDEWKLIYCRNNKNNMLLFSYSFNILEK